MIFFCRADSFFCIYEERKVVNLKAPHLFMKVTNPLSELPGVGDSGWQENVMHIIRKKNDGLLPYNASLWN